MLRRTPKGVRMVVCGGAVLPGDAVLRTAGWSHVFPIKEKLLSLPRLAKWYGSKTYIYKARGSIHFRGDFHLLRKREGQGDRIFLLWFKVLQLRFEHLALRGSDGLEISSSIKLCLL